MKRFKNHRDLGAFSEKTTLRGTSYLAGVIYLDGVELPVVLWPDGLGKYTAYANQRDVDEIENHLWTHPASRAKLDDWLKK